MRGATAWLFAVHAFCASEGFAQASRDYSPITGLVYAVADITSQSLMRCGAHFGAGVCLDDHPFAACADGSELRLVSYNYCTVWPLPEGYCYVFLCAGNPALNVALGANAAQALQWNPEDFTGAWGNTAVGSYALETSVSGDFDVAVGTYALNQVSNFGGGANVAVGAFALMQLGGGTNNVAIGARAGADLQTGNDNVYLGNGAPNGNTESGTIRIGDPFYQKRTFVAGVHSSILSADPKPVYIDVNGQLGLFTPPGAERPVEDRGAPPDALTLLESRMEAQAERIALFERALREQATELQALSVRLAAQSRRPVSAPVELPPPPARPPSDRRRRE